MFGQVLEKSLALCFLVKVIGPEPQIRESALTIPESDFTPEDTSKPDKSDLKSVETSEPVSKKPRPSDPPPFDVKPKPIVPTKPFKIDPVSKEKPCTSRSLTTSNIVVKTEPKSSGLVAYDDSSDDEEQEDTPCSSSSLQLIPEVLTVDETQESEKVLKRYCGICQREFRLDYWGEHIESFEHKKQHYEQKQRIARGEIILPLPPMQEEYETEFEGKKIREILDWRKLSREGVDSVHFLERFLKILNF